MDFSMWNNSLRSRNSSWKFKLVLKAMMDKNRHIEVTMWEGDDSERAKIRIASIGCVTKLRFDDSQLSAVGQFTSGDIMRIVDALFAAEKKRIDPNSKVLDSLKCVSEQMNFLRGDKSDLYVEMELEMPISSSGAVNLTPKFDDPEKAGC